MISRIAIIDKTETEVMQHMRILGIIVILGALLFMGYNIYMCNECTKIANDHPVLTIVSEGSNLPNNGHFCTFQPPFNEVEIGTFIVLGAGILMVVYGGPKNASDNNSMNSNKSE